MKCISVWNPWASLIVHGFKFIETRGWAAPRSLIGHTIGIASTKLILPEQRQHSEFPDFVDYYKKTELPALEDLPRGCLLGTALLHSCDIIDQEMIDDITLEERAFGWFTPGRYAWRLRYPKAFANPIPVRGAQGVWDYKGFDLV